MTKPVALITGCSSGIGRALAEALLASGHRVWASARQTQDLERLANAGFEACRLDVTDHAAVQRLADELQRREGRLDLLINNAGFGAMGPLLDGGAAALERQFATNVNAPVELARACFPLLRASRGLIVNIGSVSGVLVTPYAGAYCASKAALHALSDALRLELAPFGIRVMEVQPGAIASRFGESAGREARRIVDERSPWWPLRAGIEARARASQDHPTSAETLAAAVVRAVRQPRPPRLLRVGRGSRALPLLGRWIPTACWRAASGWTARWPDRRAGAWQTAPQPISCMDIQPINTQEPRWQMAVEVVYRSSRDPERLFMDKAEADRHDKMLELAEVLASTLQRAVPSLSEQQAEDVGIFMARHRDQFAKAFKQNLEALAELPAGEGD